MGGSDAGVFLEKEDKARHTRRMKKHFVPFASREFVKLAASDAVLQAWRGEGLSPPAMVDVQLVTAEARVATD